MPKISIYGESKVETQVSRGPRASPYQIAGVGDLAPGLNALSQGIQQMQDKIDTTSAEEALVNFEREKNDLFFNPESGYFNSQGRDAYENAKGMSDKLDELKKKYASTLKTNRARIAFDRAAQAHITRGNSDIMKHASKNLQAWEVATIKSRVENTLETAQLYWNDKERLQVQNALGRQSIMDAAKMEGIDGEALNERLQTYDSSFAKGVITAAVAQTSIEGKQALEKYGSMLEGPDKLAIDKLIEKKEKSETTEKNAAQAVLIGTNLVDMVGDADDARSQINEAVNSIPDPDLRKEVSKEANRQFELKLKADSEERAKIFEAGEKFLMNGGSVQQFKAENPEGWEKMTPTQKRKLESGEPIVTDYNQLSRLLLLPKAELAKINPADYAHVLATGDRTKLLSAVKSARTNGTDHQTGRSQTAQTTAIVRQLFGAPPRGGYNANKLKQVNAFYSLVDDEATYRAQQKGSDLTSQEYTDLLNDMTRKVVKERYLIPDAELDITDIPSESLQQLSDFLHQNNIPVTGDNLVKAYEQATK